MRTEQLRSLFQMRKKNIKRTEITIYYVCRLNLFEDGIKQYPNLRWRLFIGIATDYQI